MIWNNRLKWILAALMVFFLIVFTNLIDRNNFLQVRNSMVSLYEDRLVAKELIFDFGLILRAKERAALQNDSAFFLQGGTQSQRALEDLLTAYAQTKLTPTENRLFARFKAELAELQDLERAGNWGGAYQRQLDTLYALLSQLSDVQMDEGRRQLDLSQRAIDTIELFTKLEVYVLIALALLLQFLLLYRPRKGQS